MKIVDGLFVLPTDEAARARGYYVDLTLPNKIIGFGKRFCKIGTDDYSGKAGRPLDLETLPWQAALVRTLYGWKRPDGRLRFSECFAFLPRRQGKSLVVSLLQFYTMFRFARASCPIIASTIEEARAVYDRCLDFVKHSPKLSERCHFNNSSKKITDTKTGSEIVVLSSSKVGKLGKGINSLCGDEICAWPNHSARGVWNAIHDSLKDKVDAVKLSISTPQFDLTTLGREKWLDCRQLLDGKSDNLTLLPIIYQAPDNWRDDLPRALQQACPSLGITTPLQTYLDEWAAIQNNPLEVARFETMNLGRWCGSPEIWIPHTAWANCYEAFNEQSLTTFDRAVIGIDWGASYDLTCYTVILQKGETYYLLPRYFIPREIAQQRQDADNFPYCQLALDKRNNIHLTPGNVVDGAAVLDEMRKDIARYRVQEVLYDPTKMALVSELMAQQGINRKEVGTSNRTMSPAFELFERLALEGKLRHNGNPCSDWCLGNARPKRDSKDNLTVQKSGDRNKIDFLDAACIGLQHWIKTDTKHILPAGQCWAFSA